MSVVYKLIEHRGEKRILVLFDYDAKKLARLRANTDATWSKTHKSWHIADTAPNRIKCKLQPVTSQAKSITKHSNEQPNLPNATVENNLLPIIATSVFNDSNNEKRIELLTNKNQQLIHTIRKIKAVKWNSLTDSWHIPCTRESFIELCSITAGIALIDKKMLSAQLHKVNRGKLKVTNNDAAIKPTKKAIESNICQYNMQLLAKTMEQLQLKAYSTSTQKTYKNEIVVFLQTLKNIKADSLAKEDIRRYIHDCIQRQGLSENTIHSRLNALKFMYEKVMGYERFFVEIPRPKKQLQLPKVLGEEELRRLFAAPKNLKHKAILFVAYSAGLRVSEVINLRLQDIDRERQQLFIHCSKGKKDRYVRLSPLVLDVLEQYYKMSEVKPLNYLFEGIERGHPYTARSAQQIFTDAKNKAGISKSLSFHNLRHSFATHLLEKGVDVIFIKEILGHFNIETTQRYLHVKKEFLINIESPIDALYKDKAYI